MARPTKCTPEVTAALCAEIRRGNFAVTAAATIGISETSFYAWKRRGEAAVLKLERGELVDEEEQVFLEFAQSVKEADAFIESALVGKWLEIAVGGDPEKTERPRGDWVAIATFLERRFGDRFARNSRVMFDPGSAPRVEVVLTDAPPKKLEG